MTVYQLVATLSIFLPADLTYDYNCCVKYEIFVKVLPLRQLFNASLSDTLRFGDPQIHF